MFQRQDRVGIGKVTRQVSMGGNSFRGHSPGGKKTAPRRRCLRFSFSTRKIHNGRVKMHRGALRKLKMGIIICSFFYEKKLRQGFWAANDLKARFPRPSTYVYWWQCYVRFVDLNFKCRETFKILGSQPKPKTKAPTPTYPTQAVCHT